MIYRNLLEYIELQFSPGDIFPANFLKMKKRIPTVCTVGILLYNYEFGVQIAEIVSLSRKVIPVIGVV